MSSVLWIHTLEGRQLGAHTDDHYFLNRFAPQLDAICQDLGLTPLSTFHDFTDVNANLSEDDGGSDELDPETGWSYGIDDMTWHSATTGLATLSALRSRLAEGPAEGIPENKTADLVEELDSCIAKLTGPASRGAQFHLAVVM